MKEAPKAPESSASDSSSSQQALAETQATERFQDELRGDSQTTQTETTTTVGTESQQQNFEGLRQEGAQATTLAEAGRLDDPNNLRMIKELSQTNPQLAEAMGLRSFNDIFNDNRGDGREGGERRGSKEGQESRSYNDRDVEIDLNGTKVKFDDQDFGLSKLNTVADVKVEHGANSSSETIDGVGRRTTIAGENGDATVIEDEKTGAVHIRDAEGKYTSMYPGDNFSITNRAGEVVEGSDAQKAFEAASEQFEVGATNNAVGGASNKYANFIQTTSGRNLVTVGKDGSVTTASPEELPRGSQIERGEGSDYRATLSDGTQMIHQGGETSIRNPNGSLIQVGKDGAVTEVPHDQADKANESWSEASNKFDQTNAKDDGFDWMDAGDWWDAGKDALALGAREAGEFLNNPVATTIDWLNDGYDWFNNGAAADPGDFNADLAASKQARTNSTDVEKSALMTSKQADITYDDAYLDSLNWGSSDPSFDWFNDFDSVNSTDSISSVDTQFGKGLVNADNGDVAIKTSDNNVHIFREDGSIVTNTEKGQIIKGADGTVSYRQGDSNKGFVSQNADGSTHLEAITKDQSVKADVSEDGRRVRTEINGDVISYDRDKMSASVEEMDIAFDIGNNAGIEGLRERARENPGTTRVDNDGNVAHHDEHGDITSDDAGNVTVGDGPNALHAENETQQEADERYRRERERGEDGHRERKQRFRNESGDTIRADRLGNMNAEQLESFGLQRMEDGSYKHSLTGRTFSVNEQGRAVWNVQNSDGSQSQLELGRQSEEGTVSHHKVKDGHTADITHDDKHQTKIQLESGQTVDFNEQTNKVDVLGKDGEKESEFDLEKGELDTDALKLDADNLGGAAFFGGTDEGGWGTAGYNGFTNYEQEALESEAESREETAKATVHNLVSAMMSAMSSGNTAMIMGAASAIAAARGLVDSAVAASLEAGDTGAAATASLLHSSISSADSAHVNVTKNVNDQNWYGGSMEGDGNLGKALTQYTASISNPLIQRAVILRNMGRENDPLVQQYYNMTA